MAALQSDAIAEYTQCLVVRETTHVAAREEAVAQIANRALDLALGRFPRQGARCAREGTPLLGTAHRAEARLHAECAAQIEQQRMKSHRVASSLEHDDLGIIEQPLTRNTAKMLGGTQQRTAQPERGGVESELGIERA